MYSSYDMNPIAIEHMRCERLAADVKHVSRGTNVRMRPGVTAIAILVALAIVI